MQIRDDIRIEDLRHKIIHCPTEEEAIILLNFLYDHNVKWNSDTSLMSKTCWDDYESNTLYYILDWTICYGSTEVQSSYDIVTEIQEYIEVRTISPQEFYSQVIRGE